MAKLEANDRTRPNPSMKAQLHSDLDSLGALEDQWRDLAVELGSAFVTPEWSRAWWRHFGEDRALLLATAREEGGRLAGVMPLALDRAGRPRAIRFAGSGLGDRFEPAAGPDRQGAVAAVVIAALEEAGHRRRLLLLEHAERDSPWPGEMAAAASIRLAAIEQRRAEEPYVSLEGLDWDGYLATRSKSFRKRVRYLERSLERDHDVAVRQTAAAAELGADLETFMRLHDLRWQERGGSSIAAPAARAFLADFAAAALDRGWLRLRFLEVDTEPVAALLGWRVGGRYAFYQGGFDPAWARQSVGLLLVALTLRDAISEGASEFDFLLGEEPYKWRFADDSRAVHTVALVPARSPLRLLVGGEALARRAGRRAAGLRGLGALRRLGRLLPTSRD